MHADRGCWVPDDDASRCASSRLVVPLTYVINALFGRRRSVLRRQWDR
jgi:hypothetical protein